MFDLECEAKTASLSMLRLGANGIDAVIVDDFGNEVEIQNARAVRALFSPMFWAYVR